MLPFADAIEGDDTDATIIPIAIVFTVLFAMFIRGYAIPILRSEVLIKEDLVPVVADCFCCWLLIAILCGGVCRIIDSGRCRIHHRGRRTCTRDSSIWNPSLLQ